MSELSVSAGSEGYGACDDARDWGAPQQAETARSRKAGAKRFFASVCALALLAGFLAFIIITTPSVTCEVNCCQIEISPLKLIQPHNSEHPQKSLEIRHFERAA